MVPISKAAKILGVSVPTLYRWEKEGRLLPDSHTKGGQRRYDEARLSRLAGKSHAERTEDAVTVAYARVSSSDQRSDLERQKQLLTDFCGARGWTFEVIADLGSGMNDRKKGLRGLLSRLIDGKVDRLVLTHKDRLLRFGSELIFAVCEMRNVEVVIINQNEEASFEEELAQDVLEIITVFSARLYGARSRKNRAIIEGLQKSVAAADNEHG
ncbi:IS607 family transposase [Halorhodospira halophila]|uniref:IS607 family transposase n=1 Tax=Halorhodospira halophila TaxID=1053 RepID=UPI00191182FD|nr:IS607 family transposase [Halorhodospira halophila]MBK5942541.1 IS607 family transposase [Halorhodospira halophila]